MNVVQDEVSMVEESPQRSFYSTLVKGSETGSASSKAIVFKTPPSKKISTPRMTECVNGQLSVTALRSLLEGDFNSSFGTDTPTSSQGNCHTHHSSTKTTPELFNTTPTIVTPPGCGTPSRLLLQYRGKESPLGSSPKIVLQRIKSCDHLKIPPIHHRTLLPNDITTERSTPVTTTTSLTPSTTPVAVRTPLICSISTSVVKVGDVSPAPSLTPPVAAGRPTGGSLSSLLLDGDNVDGASMDAFALSTPTKYDHFDFSNCLGESNERN